MKRQLCISLFATALFVPTVAEAYPPAVGIVGKSRSCTSCHANNGPWKTEARTIVDILDAATRRSLRQPDGRFLLEVERGKMRTVITIIGRKAGDKVPPPKRNAWSMWIRRSSKQEHCPSSHRAGTSIYPCRAGS